MRSLRLWLALVVLVAAPFSWWLLERTPDQAAPTTAPAGGRQVAYTIRGLDAVRMTPAGVPAHRLRSPYLQHFSDDETTELEQPRLRVFQDQAPPWEIAAQRAWASADGSLLLLSGEVLIERAGDTDDRPLRILTSELRVQPREDYAETDEKVRVESESDWIDAVGMQAWLRPPSRLKFLSQVKGYYVPL